MVVRRYCKYACVTSYQLENEALLKAFGIHSDVDRLRLRAEYALVKRLDPSRPIVMTTSTSWGVPLRRPIPDIIGFSYYQIIYSAKKQKYTAAFHKPWLQRLKAHMINILWQRPTFIHELQLEPWGPKNIWEMSEQEQSKSMSIQQIKRNVQLAKDTGFKTIDLWGGEWWYWCHRNNRPEVIDAVRAAIAKNK